jgi:Fe-S cluster biosynthesis and repair protein YggX
MPANVQCSRCAQSKPGLSRPPYPGELGRQLVAHVCTDCWAEWSKREVMVINELRLNFMEPGAMEILAQYIRDFFFLPPAEVSPAAP